jgi:hypothetical protein
VVISAKEIRRDLSFLGEFIEGLPRLTFNIIVQVLIFVLIMTVNRKLKTTIDIHFVYRLLFRSLVRHYLHGDCLLLSRFITTLFLVTRDVAFNALKVLGRSSRISKFRGTVITLALDVIFVKVELSREDGGKILLKVGAVFPQIEG